MELEGKIILDLPEEGGTSRNGNLWRKKCWVLETFSQYPKKVKFDTFGDRIDTLTFEVGKSYKVSVDAESREFNGRWYTDLRAFARQEIGAPDPMAGQAPAFAQQPAAPFGGAQTAPAAPVDPFAGGANDTDDLPF